MVRIAGSSEVAKVAERAGRARRTEGGANVEGLRPLLEQLATPGRRVESRSRRLDCCTTVWSGWFESAGAPVVKVVARPCCCLDSGPWRKPAMGRTGSEKRTDHRAIRLQPN